MEVRNAFRFHTPSSILVVGPSGCGKTNFTSKLLTENQHLFKEKPKQIHYCYSEDQDGFRTMKQHGVIFHKGIPDSTFLPKWFPKGGLLVLDDLMEEGGNDKSVLDLFTKHSHHRNITVIYICQDMFPPGKYAKSISRNAHYVIAFKNPRDQLGFRNLLLQVYPTKWKHVQDRFRDITQTPYGYMMLDLHPTSADDCRLLSHLLKEEGPVRCYQFEHESS